MPSEPAKFVWKYAGIGLRRHGRDLPALISLFGAAGTTLLLGNASRIAHSTRCRWAPLLRYRNKIPRLEQSGRPEKRRRARRYHWPTLSSAYFFTAPGFYRENQHHGHRRYGEYATTFSLATAKRARSIKIKRLFDPDSPLGGLYDAITEFLSVSRCSMSASAVMGHMPYGDASKHDFSPSYLREWVELINNTTANVIGLPSLQRER